MNFRAFFLMFTKSQLSRNACKGIRIRKKKIKTLRSLGPSGLDRQKMCPNNSSCELYYNLVSKGMLEPHKDLWFRYCETAPDWKNFESVLTQTYFTRSNMVFVICFMCKTMCNAGNSSENRSSFLKETCCCIAEM